MRPCFRVARREFSQEFAQHEEKFRQCAADRAKMIKTMTDSMADLAKRVRHCEERNSDIVQGIGELDAIISEEVSKWKVGRVRCAWGACACLRVSVPRGRLGWRRSGRCTTRRRKCLRTTTTSTYDSRTAPLLGRQRTAAAMAWKAPLPRVHLKKRRARLDEPMPL